MPDAFHIAAAFWLLALSSGANGQAQYRDLHLPPYEIYDATLAYAKDGNFEMLGKSLSHFDGLLRVLSAACGLDLRAEIEEASRRGDLAGARLGLLRMIRADFSLNVASSLAEQSEASRHELVEMAYVDSTFLAEEASRRDPDAMENLRDKLAHLAKAKDDDLDFLSAKEETRKAAERFSRALPSCPSATRTR